jgi:hypothetical protein
LIEHYSDLIGSLAATHVRKVRNALSSGHARRCVICGAVEFDGYEPDYEAGCLTYTDECPSCGLDQPVYVFYFRAEAEASYEGRRIEGIGCNHKCSGTLNPDLTYSTFLEKETEHFKYADVFNNRISDHHVSYEPEITVPVCDACHGEIHTENGKYEAFEPDMKRKEWEG